MIKRVGVIGGGQLAAMMAEAAKRLGIELVVQTPAQTDPAVMIAAETIFAPVDDASATAKLAALCDVITFENEFVDLEALSRLEAEGVCFRPSTRALAPLLDKYHQRCYLKDLGLPTPKFSALDSSNGWDGEQGRTALSNLFESQETLSKKLSLTENLLAFPPSPTVLKTRRHGYDGQGTFILKDWAELQATVERLKKVPLLLEEFIPFERELAAIAARSVNGEVVVYPIVETQQEKQVCHQVLAPAKIHQAVIEQVEAIAHTLLNSLQAVGVFGIELFLTREGKVLVNEIAPRVHNSGHFTLDACATSQFEQHLRAVSGLSLGTPTMHCVAAVMVNLLGYEHST
ncbi:MAG: 5-(carboxyamino)imidazole ribonucleotide synthase, partial [Kovacikia sp.]